MELDKTNSAGATSSSQASNVVQAVADQVKGPMKERKLLFLDLETTGLNCGDHEIIEIGAVLVSQSSFEVLQTFDRKVIPSHIETATPEALAVNGYKPENWQQAIPLQQALSELSELGRGAILAGYNVTFDWAFLQVAFNQVGLSDPFYYHRLDVMSHAFMALYHLPVFSRYSLSECCRHFGIVNKKAHTALADAIATYELFVALMRARTPNAAMPTSSLKQEQITPGKVVGFEIADPVLVAEADLNMKLPGEGEKSR